MADTKKLTELAQQLEVARAAVTRAQEIVARLDLKGGQGDISCTVAGLTIDLTVSTAQTSYWPRAIPERKALMALLRKEAYDHLIGCRSKVEGIEFQIRQAAREVRE